jgi:hypothetical protein
LECICEPTHAYKCKQPKSTSLLQLPNHAITKDWSIYHHASLTNIMLLCGEQGRC